MKSDDSKKFNFKKGELGSKVKQLWKQVRDLKSMQTR